MIHPNYVSSLFQFWWRLPARILESATVVPEWLTQLGISTSYETPEFTPNLSIPKKDPGKKTWIEKNE